MLRGMSALAIAIAIAFGAALVAIARAGRGGGEASPSEPTPRAPDYRTPALAADHDWSPAEPHCIDTYGAIEPRRVFHALYETGDAVLVGFDARADGVVLPRAVQRQSLVWLQYGKRLAVPIGGLRLGAEGLSAILSFERKPRKTFIPWGAVKSIVTRDQKHGVAWREAVATEGSAA
jgi:hypothetical protein